MLSVARDQEVVSNVFFRTFAVKHGQNHRIPRPNKRRALLKWSQAPVSDTLDDHVKSDFD